MLKFWESNEHAFFPFNVRLNLVQKCWITMLNNGVEGEKAVGFNPLCNIRTANLVLI